MNNLTSLIPLVVLMFAFATPTFGDVVEVQSYDYLVSPDSRYADSSHTTGGVGELTDGITQTTVWGGTVPPTTADIQPLVGWEGNSPTIQANFDGIQTINSATIWLADSNTTAGVALPTSVTLRNLDSSFTITHNVIDPTGSGTMVPITIDGFDVSVDSLILEMTPPSSSWTMVSEFRFSAVPEPTSACLMGLVTIGMAMRRRR